MINGADSGQQTLPEDLEALVAEYKRVMPLMPVLHGAISKLAGKDAIKACGKRLRMISSQGGRPGIQFGHELEMEVFQDYLLYMYRPRGISLVRQMFNRKRFPAESDEQRLLAGMVQARFSLFWIRELIPAGGFLALDIISGKDFFILDMALPQVEATGLLAGLRILPFGHAWMHTGVSLTLGSIADPCGMQTEDRVLTEKEERAFNEEIFFRWRSLLRETDSGE
ncbi:hypothetical protein JWG43_08280 [Desulfobulbus alkaliphilus]|nr:hypothetical protein [Desulfobulbus alkaliphilus]